MDKKDLQITLNNIDKQLTYAIHEITKDMTFKTFALNIDSCKKEQHCDCPIIQIKISDKSKDSCSITKDFFHEYKELNKDLQKLVFKYMKLTNSFIEFEYGSTQ